MFMETCTAPPPRWLVVQHLGTCPLHGRLHQWWVILSLGVGFGIRIEINNVEYQRPLPLIFSMARIEVFVVSMRTIVLSQLARLCGWLPSYIVWCARSDPCIRVYLILLVLNFLGCLSVRSGDGFCWRPCFPGTREYCRVPPSRGSIDSGGMRTCGGLTSISLIFPTFLSTLVPFSSGRNHIYNHCTTTTPQKYTLNVDRGIAWHATIYCWQSKRTVCHNNVDNMGVNNGPSINASFVFIVTTRCKSSCRKKSIVSYYKAVT